MATTTWAASSGHLGNTGAPGTTTSTTPPYTHTVRRGPGPPRAWPSSLQGEQGPERVQHLVKTHHGVRSEQLSLQTLLGPSCAQKVSQPSTPMSPMRRKPRGRSPVLLGALRDCCGPIPALPAPCNPVHWPGPCRHPPPWLTRPDDGQQLVCPQTSPKKLKILKRSGLGRGRGSVF